GYCRILRHDVQNRLHAPHHACRGDVLSSLGNADDQAGGHRQLGISRLTESAMGLRDAGDTHDYAAIATPVTWAQVAKAWVRPDPRFAAVSWSRRRGNTLAT